MEILEKDFVKITYDESTEIINVGWPVNPTSDEIRTGLNTGRDFVKENNVKKWLGNTTHMDAIDDADIEWINNHWFPTLLEAGIQKMAVIVSTNVFGKMAVEDIISKVETLNGFESRYFDNEEEGEKWLENAIVKTAVPS